MILVTSGLFIDAFFYVTPDRQIHRGTWYPLMLLPMNAIMLLNVAAVIRRKKILSRKVYFSFLIALLPITITVFVQIFTDVFLLIGICTIFFILSMYGLILSDQIEHDIERQQEIARQQQEIAQHRASIMVLQMRPHFIYNTMASIYCLCSQNPENAVKHGRDPNAGQLHISIRTRKTDTGSEITVEDNGRGFNPDENSDIGIALENIRQRIEMMCSGSLNIQPREGGGTVVTVRIPDSTEK